MVAKNMTCLHYNTSWSGTLVTFQLVNTSTMFVNVSSFATHIILAATDSQIIWKLIALCFFDNVDSGKLTFLTTSLLSQNRFIGPSIGIPKHLSLICRAEI
jgi:hypothetical protein